MSNEPRGTRQTMDLTSPTSDPPSPRRQIQTARPNVPARYDGRQSHVFIAPSQPHSTNEGMPQSTARPSIPGWTPLPLPPRRRRAGPSSTSLAHRTGGSSYLTQPTTPEGSFYPFTNSQIPLPTDLSHPNGITSDGVFPHSMLPQALTPRPSTGAPGIHSGNIQRGFTQTGGQQYRGYMINNGNSDPDGGAHSNTSAPTIDDFQQQLADIDRLLNQPHNINYGSQSFAASHHSTDVNVRPGGNIFVDSRRPVGLSDTQSPRPPPPIATMAASGESTAHHADTPPAVPDHGTHGAESEDGEDVAQCAAEGTTEGVAEGSTPNLKKPQQSGSRSKRNEPNQNDLDGSEAKTMPEFAINSVLPEKDEDLELTIDSFEAAYNAANRIQPLNVTDDDLADVELDHDKWLRRIMRAIETPTYLNPLNMSKGGKKLSDDQIEEAHRWQSEAAIKVTTTLQIENINVVKELEAHAWLLLQGILDVHRRGPCLITFKVDKTSKCSDRIEAVIKAMEDYAIIRWDVLAGLHTHDIAANPAEYAKRKVANCWVNFNKKLKGKTRAPAVTAKAAKASGSAGEGLDSSGDGDVQTATPTRGKKRAREGPPVPGPNSSVYRRKMTDAERSEMTRAQKKRKTAGSAVPSAVDDNVLDEAEGSIDE